MAGTKAGFTLLGDALKKFNSSSGKKIKGITGQKGIGVEKLWEKLEARGENLTENVLHGTVDDASKFLDDALERYYNRGYTDLIQEAEKIYGQSFTTDQLDLLEKAYKNPLKDTDLSTYLKKRNSTIEKEINPLLKSDAFKNAGTQTGVPIQNGSANATQAVAKPINPMANSASVVAGDVEYNQYRLNAIQNYNAEMQATNEALAAQGIITEEAARKEGFIVHESQLPNQAEVKQKYKEALQRNINENNYDLSEFNILNEPPVNEDTPWAQPMKVALGTAVAGGALCAALSSSRGQQNNAQLYGQQPLY